MKCPPVVRDGTLEVPMTPMIDVVFLLLIFFVWTSSFEVPESDLPSSIATTNLSGGGAESTDVPKTETFDEIVITIAMEDGVIDLQFNQQPIADLATLRMRLGEVLQLDVQPPVIIDPDPQVSMADAVQVFDTARSAGASRVLFAIEET